jgi:hypothetical protein
MKLKLKKTLLIVAIVFGFGISANAQVEYMHSAGISYTGFVDSESSTFMGMPMLTYNPRLNFVLNDAMTISATTYASLGFSGSVNSQSGGAFSLGFDLPILAQLNFGHHSSKDNDDRIGGHVGAGYGLGFLTASATGSAVYHGPVLNGGIKFGIGEKVSLGFRLKYQYSLSNVHIFGLGALYNF